MKTGLARENFLFKEKDNVLQKNLSADRAFSRGQSKFFEKNPRGFSYLENLARENAFLSEPRAFFLFPLLSGVK